MVIGDRFNPRQIDAKYCVSTDTIRNLKTEVYQMKPRHKKFADRRVCKVFGTMSDILVNCRICVARFSPYGTKEQDLHCKNLKVDIYGLNIEI